MKENELRIGNWIKYEGNEIQLTKQKFKLCVFTLGLDELHEPIPLTEEWLVKFGFELYDYELFDEFDKDFEDGDLVETFLRYKKRHPVFTKTFIGIDFCKNDSLTEVFSIKKNRESDLYAPFIKHVHQLQNLYFAITGTELEVK